MGPGPGGVGGPPHPQVRINTLGTFPACPGLPSPQPGPLHLYPLSLGFSLSRCHFPKHLFFIQKIIFEAGVYLKKTLVIWLAKFISQIHTGRFDLTHIFLENILFSSELYSYSPRPTPVLLHFQKVLWRHKLMEGTG